MSYWSLSRIVDPIALLFTLGVAGFTILLASLAYVIVRRIRRLTPVNSHVVAMTEAFVPSVALVVPMYNEEAVCVESIRSLLSTRYRNLEILAVNDGSTDGTKRVMLQAFEMTAIPTPAALRLSTAPIQGIYRSKRHPHLKLIDKKNGGRSDALNAGIALAKSPLFCTVDADSILEPDTVSKLVQPFMEDRITVASGGNVRIANGCQIREGRVVKAGIARRAIEGIQTLEYLRSFVASRVGWGRAHLLMIVSGALGMFRRDLVVKLGGFDATSIGEDMELTVRLHRHMREIRERYRIAYVPDAVVWTECPGSLDVLGNQRDRWHRGLTDVLSKHRKMIFNPRYGRVGLIGMPWTVLVEFLGPILEALGYVLLLLGVTLGWFRLEAALPLLILALAIGLFNSVAALFLEEFSLNRYGGAKDLLRMVGWLLLENIGYRQLTVYWRLRGLVKYLRGDTSWGAMKRMGF